jgi:hypothetical protein
MSESMMTRVSSESLHEATGRSWDWNHKQIVAHPEGEVASSWWRQSIAVGYEQARGKREVGETADAGFQIGVRRTVPMSLVEAWDLITSRPDLWLGEGASIAFEEGKRYAVPSRGGAPGASGEVRVVKESASGKTAISFHIEKLPDADAREAMRARWRDALERIVRG